MTTFDEIFTYEHLYLSYKKCLKGVIWKQSVQNYKLHAVENLSQVYRDLHNGTYKSKPYRIFTLKYRGKTRECQSIHIYDRVVQKCLCDYFLVPEIVPHLIPNNFACLKNRGIDYAKKKFKEALLKTGASGYLLIIDIRKYFDTINHAVLLNKISHFTRDLRVLNLIKYLLTLYDKNKDGVGLALGSQMSQTFALLYISEIDNYIYHNRNIKAYGRYMDDIYIMSKNKYNLKVLLSHVKKITVKLKINVNDNKTHIVKISCGPKYLKSQFKLLEDNRILERVNDEIFYRMNRKIRLGKINEQDFNSWYNSYKKKNSIKKLNRTKYLFKKAR